MGIKKIGNWVKKNKWKIAGGVAAVGGVALAYNLGVSNGSKSIPQSSGTDISKAVEHSADIVMDFVADADGSVSHIETWADGVEIMSIMRGVTDAGAAENLEAAIKVMKENYPEYDYQLGSIVLEFIAK